MTKEELIELSTQCTIKEIAEKTGLSQNQISKMRKDFGISGLRPQRKFNGQDLTGERFGRLTVLKREEPIYISGNKKQRYLVQCDCEKHTQFIVLAQSLKSGATVGCGCVQKEAAAKTGKENLIDLTGKTFGKLLVLERAENKIQPDGGVKTQWLCECQCDKHTKIIVRGENLKTGHTTSCGCLTLSHGEEKIIELLTENNIDFEKEKIFNSCKNNGYLRFDFYIPNKNYCIEYDGNIHYKVTGGYGTADNLKAIQERDAIKTQWCKENNVPLIRMPYTHLNDLCLEDLLLETSSFIVT